MRLRCRPRRARESRCHAARGRCAALGVRMGCACVQTSPRSSPPPGWGAPLEGADGGGRRRTSGGSSSSSSQHGGRAPLSADRPAGKRTPGGRELLLRSASPAGSGPHSVTVAADTVQSPLRQLQYDEGGLAEFEALLRRREEAEDQKREEELREQREAEQRERERQLQEEHQRELDYQAFEREQEAEQRKLLDDLRNGRIQQDIFRMGDDEPSSARCVQSRRSSRGGQNDTWRPPHRPGSGYDAGRVQDHGGPDVWRPSPGSDPMTPDVWKRGDSQSGSSARGSVGNPLPPDPLGRASGVPLPMDSDDNLARVSSGHSSSRAPTGPLSFRDSGRQQPEGSPVVSNRPRAPSLQKGRGTSIGHRPVAYALRVAGNGSDEFDVF
eukprot:TRINITY_DN60404_c0_g1_i1.p2 TRINITY_DN60404_c0_g1~~TRINITY_DN60404_c0_g1_i1.p2  ORF type:complete len:383 (+),score=79.31 TRINITY_DN60404_c0_g1_i1:51-1199(+)